MAKPTVMARFWAKVDPAGPDECWPWLAGRVRNGYGTFHPTGDTAVLAHRYSYELHRGPIPEGMRLDHTCHGRSLAAGECQGGPSCLHRRCVNPAHLEVVTQQENVRRGANPARDRTHCPLGHPYDDENTRVDAQGKRHCRACHRSGSPRPNARGRRQAA